MTLAEALRAAKQRLPDPQEARWLLMHLTGLDWAGLLLASERTLTREEAESFERLLERRISGEPLQYILGTQPFLELSFLTDRRALIPREDSEVLAREALARCVPGARVLDIGAGSGILAITLARFGGACVTAVDISADALVLAQQNARRLAPECAIDWRLGDCFSVLRAGETFDIIMSNPPYIPSAEIDGLQPELRFEPRIALDGGADGLLFYRRIAGEAPGFLAPGGSILLEVGAGQADAVRALFGAFITECRRDAQGIARVVCARRMEHE